MVGCLALGLEVRPAGLLRHPEDVDGAVFVRVFGVGSLLALSASSLACCLLEGVGDVLEEDQAEDDMLVLGGVHVVAQLVGGRPERGLEAKICGSSTNFTGFFLYLRHLDPR